MISLNVGKVLQIFRNFATGKPNKDLWKVRGWCEDQLYVTLFHTPENETR